VRFFSLGVLRTLFFFFLTPRVGAAWDMFGQELLGGAFPWCLSAHEIE
jgi:hypothetical protein